MNLRALLFTLAVGIVASRAVAQSPTQTRAAAETLFREGVALAKDGNLKEACPKFEESQRLDPQTGTLVYLATCHAEQGKTATAWVEFNRAATLAARAGQTERAELARKRAAELEPKLSRITIEVQAPVAGLRVALDGSDLEAPSLGTALPLDPGEHEISASAPQYQTWSKRITVSSEPGTASIVIPALHELSAEPAAPPQATPVEIDARRPPKASSSASRTLGWVGIGVGAVGIGLGSYFGLRAISTKEDADSYCSGRFCEPAGLEKHDDAKQEATISTVAFGVGLAATGVGLALLLSSGSATERGAFVLQTRTSTSRAEVSLGRTW